LRSSASGRYDLLSHAHQGIMELRKSTGSSFVHVFGYNSIIFLLFASARPANIGKKLQYKIISGKWYLAYSTLLPS